MCFPSHRKTSASNHKLRDHADRMRGRVARLGGRTATVGGRGLAVAKTRSTAVSIAAAGVMAAGFVAGTAAAAKSDAVHAAQASTVAEASARQLAAQRVDRSGRTVATPPAATAPTPAATPPPAKKAGPPPQWVNPMPGAPLSSCYGPRWGMMHQGIDFAGDAGTEILSVGAGTVLAAGWLYAGYGMSVVVDHGNGFLSHYAHASKVLVAPGQTVKPGTPLALEGSTGDSTGPHLHFEIHQGLWNQIDPASWLRAMGVNVGC